MLNRISWVGTTPSQDASHHQDYYIFRIGDPELNLHLPQLLEGGTTQRISVEVQWANVRNQCIDVDLIWPLVGNEGINLYIGILGIHSLIPYSGPARNVRNQYIDVDLMFKACC